MAEQASKNIKLDFMSKGFKFHCELDIERKYASVDMWDEENHGYKLSIYKHGLDDMHFGVMNTFDGDRYNARASYWHSVGNLFDEDTHFSYTEKLNETEDVIEKLCIDQYNLFNGKG